MNEVLVDTGQEPGILSQKLAVFHKLQGPRVKVNESHNAKGSILPD